MNNAFKKLSANAATPALIPRYLPSQEAIGIVVTRFSALLRKFLDHSVSIQNPGVIHIGETPVPLEILVSGPLGRIGIVVSSGVSVIHENQTRERISPLIRSNAFDAIYRLRTIDLHHHSMDAAALLSLICPRFFSEDGLISLTTKASPQVNEAVHNVSVRRWVVEYAGLRTDSSILLVEPGSMEVVLPIPSLRLEQYDAAGVHRCLTVLTEKDERSDLLAA